MLRNMCPKSFTLLKNVSKYALSLKSIKRLQCLKKEMEIIPKL